jgi:peptide/nickel transport system substrate-binding protein
MKKLRILCALALALSLGAACGSAVTPSNEIKVVISEIGNNLDPLVANYTDTTTMMYHIYDTILTFDDQFNILPAVAASWSQPDNLTIQFTLGEGFKFHNGAALTPEDVVYSIERCGDIARMASFMEGVAEVSASGNTVTVKMTEPDSGFIRQFGNIIVVNKQYCQEAGEAYANAPIGTGPYTLAEYVPGDRLVLKAWPDYPFQKAKIETITFRGIAENSAKYIAVESGDADFASIAATDRERAAGKEGLYLVEKEQTYTGFVAMNTQLAPFDNVNVRRAMAHAYNYEGIAQIEPGRTVIDSMFPKMFSTYYQSQHTLRYDLDKAKALLAQEGYNEANPLTFQAWIYSPTGQPVMEAFQADLKSIGVNMEIQMLEFGVFLEKMANMEYQLLSGGWGSTDGNPLSSFECYYTGSFGNQNISFYENPRCDELYKLAKATVSPEELMAYAKEVQDIAASEVPMIPTVTRLYYYAINSRVEAPGIHTSGIISFRGASLK